MSNPAFLRKEFKHIILLFGIVVFFGFEKICEQNYICVQTLTIKFVSFTYKIRAMQQI